MTNHILHVWYSIGGPTLILMAAIGAAARWMNRGQRLAVSMLPAAVMGSVCLLFGPGRGTELIGEPVYWLLHHGPAVWKAERLVAAVTLFSFTLYRVLAKFIPETYAPDAPSPYGGPYARQHFLEQSPYGDADMAAVNEIERALAGQAVPDAPHYWV